MWEPLDFSGNPGIEGGWGSDVVAPIILHSRANLVAIDGIEYPIVAAFGWR